MPDPHTRLVKCRSLCGKSGFQLICGSSQMAMGCDCLQAHLGLEPVGRPSFLETGWMKAPRMKGRAELSYSELMEGCAQPPGPPLAATSPLTPEPP